MSMRGVSPVIATILMVMIAVGLVAFSYTFMLETGEGSKEQSDVIMEGLSKHLSSCLKVESSLGSNIWLRNCGKGYITNDSLAVYVDGNPAKFALKDLDNLSNDLPYIGEFGSGEISITDHFLGRRKVKVNYKGTLMDSETLDFGKGMEFDGSNDYVDCGNDVSLNIIDAITIEAWVKFDDLSSRSYLLSKGGYSVDGWYWRVQTDGSWSVCYNWAGSGSYPDSGINLPTGEWLHLVTVLDNIAPRVDFYKNGKWLAHTNPSQSFIGNVDRTLLIGKYPGVPHKGTIDEVRIYNRALSDDEIEHNFGSIYNPIKDGLVSWWSFDGDGCSVKDEIGNNTGSLKPTCPSDCPVRVDE
ncbi:MAG: hypothetical protein KAU95_01145 [Candidatus Aenigmarchaeota archaeon]|nr:hypothetical protein [Candidatus Aenigmarchaeota archaeon]